MTQWDSGRSKGGNPKGTLGMFAGVFTPSILTILGIILFLRLGYVVGSAGLGRALILIGLANAISIITSMSLAAITTNLRVKGGGVYYLISRTLGVQFGGSIGIVLFLAQAVSIAFYCMGFAEALCGILPDPLSTHTHIISAVAVFLLFVLAWLGADWATRFQYVVMAILAAALVSFFAGALSQWDSGLLVRNWSAPASGPDFWLLFAIFFPAVTGFTQGVNMSGDLKDPGKSIPLGTFLAVGLSVIIYFAAAILFSASLPNDVLAVELEAMNRLALLGFLIHAGVISATLSSAMASFLGAPRILQSLAADMIFPFLRPFAKGFGPTGNPRRGVLLSAGIAFVTVGLGELDLIAPVVSMFFLISYGLLNYATFYEARAASPSFRPRFRWFDARLSLLGGIACLGVMLAIDWAAGVVAVSVLFAVYQYLQRAAGPARWADSRRSFHLQRIRESLIAAENEPEHPRDWRPQVLAFSDDPSRRERLLRFASWIEGGSGMTTAVRILVGEGLKMHKLKEKADSELRFEINQIGLSALPRVVVS
ncbi:MAG: amino acid permease, partial [Deltaproteobacteria bacterium]|nr:amino acid permease [Deltaproteobacteria bacterium]